MDIKLIQEIAHAHNINSCVNLTDSDGVMALHSVYEGKPFVGFTYSQQMLEKLENFVVNQIFQAMKTPGDKLHELQLQNLLATHNAPASGSVPLKSSDCLGNEENPIADP